jgi:hypothetical protein
VGDDASGRSLDVQAVQLREFVAELAARVAAIEAMRDRVERRERIDEILASAVHAPAPRHAAPKRDRHGLRVIPGGLVALVPAPGHGAAALVPVAGQLWLSRRNWPRWAVAALALGLAGATAVPTAASVRDQGPPAVTCAHQCGAGEGTLGHLARLPWPPMVKGG